MPPEILSVAIYEPLPEMEAASLATIRELIAILSAKGYSRDFLYHSGQSEYVLLRYWKSEESRRAAQEDPEIHRYWARLGNEIRIIKVCETLERVELGNIALDAAK
jgi:heme-degrading monooxygenase HmoA